MRHKTIIKRIKYKAYPVGAEIGVFQGELSKKLLETHPSLKLHMIDNWGSNTYDGKDHNAVSDRFRSIYTDEAEHNFLMMQKNIEIYRNRTHVIRKMSNEAVNFYSDKYFDFVFIDGSHDYESVKNDIELWLPKVKKGGYICGHDYGVENFPEVKQAVDEIFPEVELDEDFTWFIKL